MNKQQFIDICKASGYCSKAVAKIMGFTMDISRYFKEVQPLQFVDCDIAYRVRKEHSEAYIAIDGDEVVCSLIQSYKSGAGSDMIATLEQLAKDNGYSMVFFKCYQPKTYRHAGAQGLYERLCAVFPKLWHHGSS